MTGASTPALAVQTHSVSTSPVVNLALFGLFVAATLFLVYRVNHQGGTVGYFAANRGFTGSQNGIALCGDFLSAASFLGIAGAIAVHGYDGFLYSIGFLVAWLVNLLLVAELVRNTGRFTFGDVISYRMRQRPVRAAAAVSTLVISLFYLIAQLAGAGGLVALLLDVHGGLGQAGVLAAVGVVMLAYVLIGGMKGTTYVQIVKAAMLLLCVGLLTLFLLGKFGFSVTAMMQQAAENNPLGDRVLAPGTQYGENALSRLDFVSLSLALVLGVAGLPHVVMRFYTVTDSYQARRSVVWATTLMTVFYLCTLVIGYGAGAMIDPAAIRSAPGGENSAVPLLAFQIGGSVLLGVFAAVAFATILAVVAGLTLTASASFAHDVYATMIKRGGVDAASEIRVARLTAVVIGFVAIIGSILVSGVNVAFLVGLAFAIAASANLSTLLFSLFWRRFNTTGTLWAMYGGLGSCLVLILFSPVTSGAADSILPWVDFAWFPLSNPGIVSIPISFLCGYLGTVLSADTADPAKADEMEVRALTGIGAVR